jgi:hypothetical protein
MAARTLGLTWRDVSPFQLDATLLGFVKARNGVEQTGFARTIGTNDSGDFAGFGLQGHATQCLDTAKAQVNIFNRQQG